MSTEFRLKLPNGIDYRNSLLKNGTCCDGYTAVSGASYDSYVSCREQGWHFIHATGSTACGDQSLGATLFGNDQTFWYWWYNFIYGEYWPWGREIRNYDGVTNLPKSFLNDYKTIEGFGFTNGVGFTLTGRPQRIPGTNPLSINYWDNPIEEADYKHPNFLIKNNFWPPQSENPKLGIIWNDQGTLNNGYSMPGSTGFEFYWEPLPPNLSSLINEPNLINFDIGPITSIDSQGITAQLLDFRRFKYAHPYSKRILQPRTFEARLSQPTVGAYWYSLLTDGSTAFGPRNQLQRVYSPWQDHNSESTSQSLRVYLEKLRDQLGITLPYVFLDDEYLNNTFGSGFGDNHELINPSTSEYQYIYIPDREHPIPGMKGHSQFNGTTPEWEYEPNWTRPSNWTSGITWWTAPNGLNYYRSYKNPNGNSIRNTINDPRWSTQGLTHLEGLTLGALFTKRYNDLRSAWIEGFSGTSQANIISNSTIPTSTEMINFFSGWSGQYIKGTTHQINYGNGWTQYRNLAGETKIWLPATTWITNTWPNFPAPNPAVRIDGITMYNYGTTWTPYGGTAGVRTLSNITSQIQFNTNAFTDEKFYFNQSFIDIPSNHPSQINRSAWAWSLLHVFVPTWDCIIGDIQISQYYYDTFSEKIRGITGYSSGISFARYDSFDMNAEESIYLIRSNAAELFYRLSGKNSMHCPIEYNTSGILPYIRGGNMLFPTGDETLNELNAGWNERLGYVKSATTKLEKYKIYHLAGSPVVGLNGITIDPPQSGNSYCLARWPSNEFIGLTPGFLFSDTDFSDGMKKDKLRVSRNYSAGLIYLQLLRGIMRSDPMGHNKLFPMIYSGDIDDPDSYRKEMIYHIVLHGAKIIGLFNLSGAELGKIVTKNCIQLEKLLTDINTITGGGKLVPLGKFNSPDGTTWAESGSTGANDTIVKMDQLILEDSFHNYIMTGAKVVTGPFTGRYIWRITISPVKINWTGRKIQRPEPPNPGEQFPRENLIGSIRIIANGITHDQYIGDITKQDYERSPGIFVITNNNSTPTIQISEEDITSTSI